MKERIKLVIIVVIFAFIMGVSGFVAHGLMEYTETIYEVAESTGEEKYKSQIAKMYIAMVNRVMNEDIALNYNMKYIAIDIDTFINASEEDIVHILKYLENYHENIKQTTFEELANEGLVDEEPPFSIEGVLLSITDAEFISETKAKITINKFRSGRGAIWLTYELRFEAGEWNLEQYRFGIS